LSGTTGKALVCLVFSTPLRMRGPDIILWTIYPTQPSSVGSLNFHSFCCQGNIMLWVTEENKEDIKDMILEDWTGIISKCKSLSGGAISLCNKDQFWPNHKKEDHPFSWHSGQLFSVLGNPRL
jgi:hypothetical protein